MKTLQELQPLIVEWANNKNFVQLEFAPQQRLKLIEECGELAGSILKNNINNQKDAIGDIFVVLVILAEQLNSSLDFDFILRDNAEVLFFINSVLNYAYEHSNNIYFSTQYLNGLAIELEHDLTECANLAWNEIKNRTGKTVNGTFIKD
tara:strand:+ start:73 stop:519 length:447 start_codon:yes stop_codon:yes gene_type:complete